MSDKVDTTKPEGFLVEVYNKGCKEWQEWAAFVQRAAAEREVARLRRLGYGERVRLQYLMVRPDRTGRPV